MSGTVPAYLKLQIVQFDGSAIAILHCRSLPVEPPFDRTCFPSIASPCAKDTDDVKTTTLPLELRDDFRTICHRTLACLLLAAVRPVFSRAGQSRQYGVQGNMP